MTKPNFNTESLELDRFLNIFAELAQKAATGLYIYRGENELYETVSSSLYRRYNDVAEDGAGLEAIQNEILEQARAHSPDMAIPEEDATTLSELRHNGGETNVLDFTSDYWY